MSLKSKYTCGDCDFIALKRHYSKCMNSCAMCELFYRQDYVCKNRTRDYCTNANIVGKIDRTYPACDDEFMLSGASAEIYPMRTPEYYPRKSTRKAA